MLTRRLVYIALLASAVLLWYLGSNILSGSMLGPVLVLMALLLGIPSLIAAILNPPLLDRMLKKREPPDAKWWVIQVIVTVGGLVIFAVVKDLI